MRFRVAVLFFLILFFSITPSFAIQEVLLDIEGETSEDVQEDVITDDEWYFDLKGKTLKEKISEINAKEIHDISKTHYLLEEILTKKFDKSPVDTMHIFGYYRAGITEDFYPDDADTGYEFSSLEGGVNGKFKDGKTFYEARMRFKPQHDYNFLQYMPSNVYIASTAIPNNTIIFGNTRVATGCEGSKSSSVIPFVARAQIARNFGNIRKVGVRVKGKYDLVDYDFGGYSSDTYFRKFFPGAEFAGWVTFKPLGKTNGKYGVLKLGGGLTAGQNEIDYNVIGTYASYTYKNFYANFEWGKADGYNGSKVLTSNKAEGLYTTLGYRITPKIQLVARYDQYRPNLDIANNMQKEYSAGVNYFLKGQALKMMLNYVFCQNEAKADSHRVILGTQLML